MNIFCYKYYILISVLLVSLAGCSTNNMLVKNDTQDITNDPYEKLNRDIFEFNNNLDDYFFKPVAKGWRKLPDFPKENLANMAETAYAPLNLANALLQFDAEGVGLILSRFLINLTFGFGGMYDVASSEEFGGIEKRTEDFGQTLAVWGVDEGAYIMLPIFGPSNIRDAVGRGIDAVLNPMSFAFRMNNIGIEGRLTQPVIKGVDTRELYLDYLEEIEESSLDYYATMRSLYQQKRKTDIKNGINLEEKISYDINLYDDIYDEVGEIDSSVSSSSTIRELSTTIKKKFNYKGSLPSSNSPQYKDNDLIYFLD